MTEAIALKSMPFDSNEIYNEETGETTFDRVAFSKDLADWMRNYFSNGILVKGSKVIADELQVTHTGGLNLSVNKGEVIINGRTGWVESATELTVDMGGSNDRIDRVVMELNVADRYIYLKLLKGTEAETPEAPALTQTEDVFQIPLAQVKVNAETAAVASVTDERPDYISNVTIGIEPPTANSAEAISVSSEVQTLLGVDNVDDGLKKSSAYASYLALCSNVNTDSIDCALGKNNENNSIGVCSALALYSYFMGTEESEEPFINLRKCTNLASILDNGDALIEASNNSHIMYLLLNNKYASDIVGENLTIARLCSLTGRSPVNYINASSICSDRAFMDDICTSQDAFHTFINSESMLNAMFESNTAKASMYENASAMMSNELCDSTVAKSIFDPLCLSASKSNGSITVGNGKVLAVKLSSSGDSNQYGYFNGFVGTDIPSNLMLYGNTSKYAFYFSSSLSIQGSRYGTASVTYIPWDYE